MYGGVGASIVVLLVVGACSSASPTLDDVLRDAEETADIAPLDGAEPGVVTPDLPAIEASVAGLETDNHDPAPGVDPFAVPERIDAAYVELVVDELLGVLSDALRAHLADEDPGGLRTEAVFREIYGAAQLDVRLDDLWQVFSTEEGRATQYPPEQFGVQRFEVLELLRVREDCVTSLGLYDVTETSRFPYGDQPMVFVISRDERFRSPTNPTAWRLWSAARALTADGEPLPLDELGALDDLEVLVDADCSGAVPERGSP